MASTTAYDKMVELGLEGNFHSAVQELAADRLDEFTEGLKNTKYIVKRFRRRLGDATQLVEGDASKWKDRSAQEGYQYALRMDWRLEKIDSQEFKDTFLHEMAHIIDYMIRGHSGHDRFWETIASALGARPEACKDMGSTSALLQGARVRTSVRNLGC